MFTHDGFARPHSPEADGDAAHDAGRRYRTGVIGVADREPGVIRVNRPVVEAMCRHHQRLREAAIADHVRDGEALEDAICYVDGILPRIFLLDGQLVLDQRHVAGDSDAITATAPRRGRYRIGLGYTWYRVDARLCDTILDDKPSSTATATIVLRHNDLQALAAGDELLATDTADRQVRVLPAAPLP
ncbi:hypothetical protein Ais01nite_73800 [Asanoa ishikariensis]|uniref:hypothetical protein n=1 Tax=Asanoa ishikariensis TaxID=137265 RepID=UPI00115F8260|nr:hypothetical protein [Asanoa ishikariensis]GIF69345.1 hypothetical protein Ais01nite_73800 [Asanoa ishikariensis]